MTENSIPTLYCVNHPKVETTLRCNRCENPICVKCATLTPTGYRCKDCVSSQLKVFDTAVWYDYILGFVVTLVLSVIASFGFTLISAIGFFGWIIAIAAAPTAGMIIAEAARFATRRHRAKALYFTVIAAIIIGALPVIIRAQYPFDVMVLIFQGIYLVLVVPTVYYRLSGIQLFK